MSPGRAWDVPQVSLVWNVPWDVSDVSLQCSSEVPRNVIEMSPANVSQRN